MLLLSKSNPVKQLWQKLGQKFSVASKTSSSPKAILLISAHYNTRGNEIRIAARDDVYPLNYDFYGFPDELYKVKYEAKGSVAMAQKVRDRIRESSPELDVTLDSKYAMDHGAFLPLIQLTGDKSEIPVVVMSVNTALPVKTLLEMSRKALAPLRDDLLIVASGSEVHNIPDFFKASEVYGDVMPVTKASVRFGQKLREVLEGETEAHRELASRGYHVKVVQRAYEGDILSEMAEYRKKWPHAQEQHPTDEHFRPLFYAVGAAVREGSQGHTHVLDVQYIYDGKNPTGVVVFGEAKEVV